MPACDTGIRDRRKQRNVSAAKTYIFSLFNGRKEINITTGDTLLQYRSTL